MRIALVTGSFPKLSETFVLDQVTALLDLGHDVRVFSLDPASEAVKHPAVERYGLSERTKTVGSPRTGLLAGALRALPELGSWAGALPYGRELRLRFDHGAQGQFDVIYCHFGHVAERARRLVAAGFFSGPLIAVFHAYDLTVVPRERGRSVYASLFRDAARLLPISERWRRELVELGADPEKVEVRRLGVDLQAFRFRERVCGRGETLKLISVARMVEKKGLVYGLEAVARLRSQLGVPVEYHVVGDGPLRIEIETRARALELLDCVHLHGAQDRSATTALLEGAHLLLVPSVVAENGDAEGMPVVILEAMALGVPVIASAHSGIPEVVRDGITGRLAAERDADGIARAALELRTEPERALLLARNARRLIEAEHDGARLNRDLAALFESLAGQKRVN